MLEDILISGLLGAFGGFIRSIVGLLKALSVKKKIRFGYWLITILIGVLVGIVAGIAFGYDYRISILAGYAGTDGLEGIYKMTRKG